MGESAPPGVQPLRTIHVGAGGRGRTHLRAALETGYCRPVALVDVVPDNLAAARATTGLPESACFTRIEDALAAVESEAVAIATPVMFHAPQIMAALGAGRHVLTEKCFTVGLDDALACVAEAEAHDRKIMVVQNARLWPHIRTLRRLIGGAHYGPLGLFQYTLLFPRSAPFHFSPHMHLWQQGVHEIDSMLAVVQRPVRRVWGLSNSPAWCEWPSESFIQALLECDGAVSGTHLSSTNSRGPAFSFRLECAQAAIICTDQGSPLEIRWGPRDQRSELVPLDPPDARGLEHVPAIKALLAAGQPVRGALANFQIYRNFYEYVTAGIEPESSGRHNLETMRVLDGIVRSTAQGQPVTVA